ncbi:ABC transporter permease [Cellulomonas olei]|uniref:ABC transporter permease n=1 Tax=Cellulomonas sp. P4 TaxID=3142533 RepID=UPI0031BA3968
MSRLRTSWTDLVDDVTAELVVARSRAVTILVGVALSTGALVSSAGISATARDQIAADLAASTVDSLTVSAAASARAGGAEDVFPDDTEARVRELTLVREAGRVLELDGLVDGLVTRLPGTGPVDVPVLAATSGYLAARDSGAGQAPVWLLDGSEPVALLGLAAADALGVPVVDDPTGLTVQIDGATVQVVGYLTTRDEALAASIVVPYLQGVERLGSDARATLLVRSEVGGGPSVAEVVRAVVRPDRPDLLVTSPVVALESLRQGVSAQFARLVAWIGALLLAITALLISNSTASAVTARTPEIGLRRALGASRGQVTRVVVAEGALTGLLGGAAGTAVGLSVVVVVAAASSWSVDLDPTWALPAPALGLAVGVVASLHPASRASRISPALAVRHD